MSDWKNICKDKDSRPKEQKYKNWKELTPIPISFPDNAMQTGNWRSFRPVLDKEKCTKCGICWLYCPEGTIKQGEDGYYVIDLTYCKGCGICAHECPVGAMEMVTEEEAQESDVE
ncbi:MAG: 4Fe-4S dicluster domain-containing protein [Candidatus Lokiarchaeota archaeon]|nr:4Fe-4S dicluster domain-containing protein [Candidatus Lokiarchaeota archaeon]